MQRLLAGTTRMVPEDHTMEVTRTTLSFWDTVIALSIIPLAFLVFYLIDKYRDKKKREHDIEACRQVLNEELDRREKLRKQMEE